MRKGLRRAVAPLAIAGALVLSACGGSGSPVSGGGATASAVPVSAAPSATTRPQASPTGPAGAPTPVPVCQLMPREAATLVIGAPMPDGVQADAAPLSRCVFGTLPQLVVEYKANVNPDQAKAFYESEKANIPPTFTKTERPDLFDGAVIAHIVNAPVQGSGIYVIDGSNFFDVVCIGVDCADSKLVYGAEQVAGRLP